MESHMEMETQNTHRKIKSNEIKYQSMGERERKKN